ncbi:MAG: Histone chaperone asf1 [Gomphillus americanus]|uniref:Histone chaperone n=1 Tax=Gomphillus americanus TaxID=1940652 RepID=A0A8H3EVQ0_9LECA|nr:MAG: Histone chaperone asf1 [Gomphillus americanus]
MSVVSLLGVKIKNNPAKFLDNYELEITFEALEPLQKDLEWKLIYVGSATSSEYDQELDSILVGPVAAGVNKFEISVDPPNLSKIPNTDVVGVTVILLSCSYDGREFVRVGYYVNNEYDSEELNAEPPAKPDVERVLRNILAEKPRVTRFAIKWDSDESAPAEFPPEQPEADHADDDADRYGAEEIELEDALLKEDAALEAQEEAEASANPDAMHEDNDDESDAGSEDLEAESSDDDDEEEEEAEGEEEGDGDIEMGDGDEEAKPVQEEHAAGHEVMVH